MTSTPITPPIQMTWSHLLSVEQPPVWTYWLTCLQTFYLDVWLFTSGQLFQKYLQSSVSSVSLDLQACDSVLPISLLENFYLNSLTHLFTIQTFCLDIWLFISGQVYQKYCRSSVSLDLQPFVTFELLLHLFLDILQLHLPLHMTRTGFDLNLFWNNDASEPT